MKSPPEGGDKEKLAHMPGLCSNQILGVLADWCVILRNLPPEN
jgi:hypothetical protein